MVNRSQISRSLQIGKATLPSSSDPFLGLLLKDRYLLEAYWTRGQFGKFYLAKDVMKGEADRSDEQCQQLVVKISSNLEMNKKEYMILGRLNQLSPDGQDFPVLHAGGEFIVDSGAEEPMRVSSSVVLKHVTLPHT